jgi:transposase
MEQLIERSAGLDVHKATVSACVRVPKGDGRGHRRETRRFATTTHGVTSLGDWLERHQVTVVGMESTGVYWKPVYYLLEDRFECWLLNAQHMHNLPGRKTDVADAAWIADLVAHGLVRPSFVPPKPIRELLAHIDYIDEAIERVSEEVERHVAPFAREIELLDTIPGVNRRTAEVLLAEVGPDKSRFTSSAHLASWAGMCPGNNESAGKHRSGKTRKGSPWIRTCLVEAAQAASRTKDTYLSAQYARFKRRAGRTGHKKAVVAVGHTLLVVVFHILERRQPYADLGADYFTRRQDSDAHRARLVRQLERLGYQVKLESAA